jgi:heme-degrading monooxygenase HmoA
MAGRPLTVINCFEVPAERQEEFLTTWRTFHDIQCRQPGFLSNRMHRAADEETRFRFVNVSQWESMEHYRTALASDEFRQRVTAAGPAWQEFGKTYGRYEVVEQFSHRSATTDGAETSRP